VTREGLADLDGDGRPEYVDADQPAGETYWKVWFQKSDGPGFVSNWVAWPVPTPVSTSAMADRRYHLDFTENIVVDYDFSTEVVRYIAVGDEISFDAYEVPSDKSWVRVRQRPVHALVDMNADGRPDLVDVGLGASIPGQPGVKNYGGPDKGQVRVYWNLGNGFATT
jgi:hypothetical protein